MATSRGKPLSEWTDDEIVEILRVSAKDTAYSVAAFITEQDRREARKGRRLTQWTAIAAAVAAIFSAVAAFLSLARQ